MNNFISLMEKHLWWLSLSFFVMGIFFANQSIDFAYFINDSMESFIDGYGYFAPIAIYLILTPTLVKLFLMEVKGKKFAKYTIKWFVVSRLIASLYAVIVTVIIFDLPIYSGVGDGFIDAVIKSMKSLIWMLTNSVYFYAVYASIITVLITFKISKLGNFLAKGVDAVEYLGKFIIPIIPLLMLAVGAYITILPEVLEKSLGNDIKGMVDSVTMLGFTIDITSSLGMILLYVSISIITGIVCGIWHIGLLVLVKKKEPNFSLKNYFSEYWIKVYPMLWATSSEALATPLNLHMVKKFCPTIPNEVRQFIVGAGSFLNINGTIINVFLMTGLVVSILGIEVSFVQLLLCIPIVVLIGYGVPGIPGELVLFGGPVAMAIGVSPELMPIFLALYIGLQIGLPDSFRTAANSTDECLCTIILNKKY